MADQKITALAELTTVAAADMMAVVDDPSGTPVTKKATVENVAYASAEYGSIYVDNGVATQTVDNGTPALLTCFANDGVSSAGVTPTVADDKITVTNTGIYKVMFAASFSGDANITWYIALHWNGAEQSQCEIQRKLGVGGDTGACAFSGLVDVTAGGTDFEVYIEPDGAAKDVIFDHANLSVLRIGLT